MADDIDTSSTHLLGDFADETSNDLHTDADKGKKTTIFGLPVDMKELGEWWHITWTAGIQTMLRYALPFVDVSFLGHLSTGSLGAAGASRWRFVDPSQPAIDRAAGAGDGRMSQTLIVDSLPVSLPLAPAIALSLQPWPTCGSRCPRCGC